jgi:signal transduction histidine kinase
MKASFFTPPTIAPMFSSSAVGIDPAFLPHLFERFTQADSSLTRAHQGLGLGLAIVRQMVELHGGVVSAHSAGLGTGATFRVELPVRPGAGASIALESHRAAPPIWI